MVSEKMVCLGRKGSVIREIFEYGKKRKAEIGAENVFDFSLGNPSVPAPAEVTDTLVKLLQESEPTELHGYTSSAGDWNTRQKIADYLNQAYNAHASAAHIYMTCGAAASLTISLNAILEKGEEVIIFSPYFPEYTVFVEQAGGIVVPVLCREEDFQPDSAAFAQSITKNTKAVIINSPNNPSGAVISSAMLTEICGIMKQKQREFGHEIYLIADEPYRELAYDGVEVPYATQFYDNTIVCYSFSKSLSLPGERIGYILVSDRMNQADTVFAAINGAGRALGYVCAPSLFQKLIPYCLGKTSDKSVYARNREKLYQALVGNGFCVVKPEGAFYIFMKVPGGDANCFCEMAKKYELLLVPSDDFCFPGYVRISYCVSEEQVERSLPAFAKLAQECFGK